MLTLPPITSGQPLLDTIHHTDLLTLCGALPSQSVDMILCDLPYGTTACSWDTIIPLEPMWQQFKRVIKPRGAIVLTASQPFTSKLVMSAIDWFKYEWVWDKHRAGNFFLANCRPMRVHEDILIFSNQQTCYYPQVITGDPYRIKRKNGGAQDGAYGKILRGEMVNSGTRQPSTIVDFGVESNVNKQHPTQKPVALFEYLIRTYTQAGEIVLDPCIGSGTTAIAARQTGRHFIGGDSSQEYVTIARARLAKPYTPPLFLDEQAV